MTVTCVWEHHGKASLIYADQFPGAYTRGATRLFLAHLSKDNNSPELAYLTAQSALTEAGMREDMDFVLRVAPRTDLEPVMVF